VKKTKRLLSLILSGVLLGSTAVFTANAANDAPEYSINFYYDVDAREATAEITLAGGTYGMGRFGFTYNTEILTLVDSEGNAFDPAESFIANAILGVDEEEYTVTATEETNLTSALVNVDEGKVLSAWYADEANFIDASAEAKVIAVVNFKLSETVLEADNVADEIASHDDLVGVYDEEIPDDVKGWSSPYEAVDEDFNKETGDENVVVNNIFSAAAPEITVRAAGTNVTTTWEPIPNESEAKVVAYRFEIVDDEDGSSILDDPYYITVEVGGEYFEDGKYSVKMTKDDGITRKHKYNITVTPITESGEKGLSATKSVTIKSTSSSDSGTSGVVGGELTYTVVYNAGEGTIPEGQKFKYNVTRNGYVTASPEVIAPEGKVFAGWSVDGTTLVSVEVYRITKDTTFTALYVENEADTHRPFILGYPGSIVKADAFLTRAEAAAIIARASGNFDSEKTYTSKFSDVPEDHWAANYIAYVYENNIVLGYEDDTFHPSSNITRAEFATIMQRFLGIELNEDALFVDVAKDHWAVAYIGACKDAGLINGYENGEFRPANSITRAEAVKILNRATDRIPTADAIDAYIAEKGVPFEDLDADTWYFYEIMEAAFPHLISYYH